ncbi:NitT/TauT family transport system permease protein [Herbihabitans rhizosphaerae]|uniref:NitT/TauT family transport system permease protein n=1 Tax=Herbihabitans rhizosphaerae TaxID=1872711 RepID=A0A4Q7KWK5_9PSEU|nr:ABC transporter permease [Herbihabitans rhizosphaerae]RZS41047.1 NitT/TauT family transport system permease protein [Herbihabitans rhizosphaerae]
MLARLQSLIGLAGFFLVWEVASRTDLVPSYYVPPPSTVLPALVRMLGEESFLRAAVATVLATLIAVVIAAAIAIPAGLVLGSMPAVRRATMVIIEFLRPIPSAALIPLFVLLIGAGSDTKISLAVYGAVWPILFNTMYALDEVDPLLTDTARAFGMRRSRIMSTVSLPSAAPFALTGIRLSATIALAVVMTTELYGGGAKGLGQYVLDARNGFRMDLVLAATLVAGLIGYLLNAGFERLHRRMFAWQATGAETGAGAR